ncbi:MAG: hypothetical protein AAGM84_02940 [Pseudomonadota bacterium]
MRWLAALALSAGAAQADPLAFLEARGCTIGPQTEAQAEAAGVDYAAVEALAPALTPPYTVLPPETCTIRLPEVQSDWLVLSPTLLRSYQTGEDGRGCYFGDTVGAFRAEGASFEAYLAFLAAGFLSGELRYFADNPLGTPPGIQVTVGTCGDTENRAALDAYAAALTDELFDQYVRAKGAEQSCADPGFTPKATDLAASLQDSASVNYLLWFELDILAWASGFRTGMSWTDRGTPIPPLCHLP